MIITISTTIPSEWKEKIVLNHWKTNELIGLGIAAKENNPQLLARIDQLERTNKRIMARLERFASTLIDLKQDLPED